MRFLAATTYQPAVTTYLPLLLQLPLPLLLLQPLLDVGTAIAAFFDEGAFA